ncbi:MAG: helix-turn-helix transcriptional regulator [Sandaracinus sp.]|nr:helix-turn-helix transcriptional regulator [Sandaracinus sp.]MCB9633988.1 helix-turn-helix transcriptional regulator [Sandaracinus sp.]
MARSVFAEKGYHHTHVADIIEAAGIARGTFYLYFESKSAIFLELLEQLLSELRSSIVGVDTSDTAPPVQVQLVDRIRRILHLVVENRALTTILVREAVGLDAEVDAKMREFYQSLHFYLRDALENGKTMGILRDLDTEVAAFCVLGTIKQLMEQLVMSEDGKLAEDVDRVALGVLDFNLRGLIGR